jgi:hypothetical protein
MDVFLGCSSAIHARLCQENGQPHQNAVTVFLPVVTENEVAGPDEAATRFGEIGPHRVELLSLGIVRGDTKSYGVACDRPRMEG